MRILVHRHKYYSVHIVVIHGGDSKVLKRYVPITRVFWYNEYAPHCGASLPSS